MKKMKKFLAIVLAAMMVLSTMSLLAQAEDAAGDETNIVIGEQASGANSAPAPDSAPAAAEEPAPAPQPDPQPEVVYHQVVYMLGSYTYATYQVREGNFLPRPTKEPEREGYEFKYWFRDGDPEQTKVDFDNLYAYSDMVFHAKMVKVAAPVVEEEPKDPVDPDGDNKGDNNGNLDPNAGNGDDNGNLDPNPGNGDDSGNLDPNAGNGDEDGNLDPNAGNGDEDGNLDPNAGNGDEDGNLDPNAGNGDDNGNLDPNPGNGDEDGNLDPNAGNGDDSGNLDPNAGNGDDNGSLDPNAGNGDDNGNLDPNPGNGDGDPDEGNIDNANITWGAVGDGEGNPEAGEPEEGEEELLDVIAPQWNVTYSYSAGAGDKLYIGDAFTFYAHVEGDMDIPHHYQWQMKTAGGWVDIPGANGLALSLIVSDDNYTIEYGLVVIAD